MASSRKHLLLLPMPAFGHIIPLLELARKLSAFHRVTFAVTEIRVEQMRQRGIISPDDEANAYLTFHGIQDGAEDFDIEDPQAQQKMGKTFMKVFQGIGKLLESMPVRNKIGEVLLEPVDYVIADGFVAGPASVCLKRGVGLFQFHSTSTTMTLPIILQINEETKVVPDMNGPPMIRLKKGTTEVELGLPPEMKQMFLGVKKTFSLCTGIIINDIRELENPAIIKNLTESELGKNVPLRIVGPLIGQNAKDSEKDAKVIEFLDQQKANSVVYISFGSMFVLQPEQIREVGKALIELDRPAIWSLPERKHQFLPEEIQNCVSSKLLISPWVPQRLILEHEATAVFVSHCGWNSILEAFDSGVPVISWPLGADQYINGDRVVSLGIGEMIEGTGMKGRIVPAQEIVEIVMKVAGWENGSDDGYGKKARQVRDSVRRAVESDGSSWRDLRDLIDSDIGNSQES